MTPDKGKLPVRIFKLSGADLTHAVLAAVATHFLRRRCGVGVPLEIDLTITANEGPPPEVTPRCEA